MANLYDVLVGKLSGYGSLGGCINPTCSRGRCSCPSGYIFVTEKRKCCPVSSTPTSSPSKPSTSSTPVGRVTAESDGSATLTVKVYASNYKPLSGASISVKSCPSVGWMGYHFQARDKAGHFIGCKSAGSATTNSNGEASLRVPLWKVYADGKLAGYGTVRGEVRYGGKSQGFTASLTPGQHRTISIYFGRVSAPVKPGEKVMCVLAPIEVYDKATKKLISNANIRVFHIRTGETIVTGMGKTPAKEVPCSPNYVAQVSAPSYGTYRYKPPVGSGGATPRTYKIYLTAGGGGGGGAPGAPPSKHPVQVLVIKLQGGSPPYTVHVGPHRYTTSSNTLRISGLRVGVNYRVWAEDEEGNMSYPTNVSVFPSGTIQTHCPATGKGGTITNPREKAVNLALGKGTAIIHVLDKSGHPVAGAEVVAEHQWNSRQVTGTTDDRGYATLHLGYGGWTTKVHCPDGSWHKDGYFRFDSSKTLRGLCYCVPQFRPTSPPSGAPSAPNEPSTNPAEPIKTPPTSPISPSEVPHIPEIHIPGITPPTGAPTAPPTGTVPTAPQIQVTPTQLAVAGAGIAGAAGLGLLALKWKDIVGR